MKNMTRWAAASAVIAVLGACTTEVETGNSDGGVTSAGGGGGSSNSTTGGGTAGTTGGSGGSSSDDGGSCSQSATATACEKCSFSQCMMETCACYGNSNCKGAIDDFWTCVSMPMSSIGDCTTAFSIAANADMMGGSLASDVATCMSDSNCENACKGLDGGIPRRQPRP
jgi:hypothetical protein